MSFLSEYFGVIDNGQEHQVLCPFPHTLPNGLEYFENRPSAHVNTDKGLFHCKACGRGLNEHQFIQERLGCSDAAATKVQTLFGNEEDLGEWIQSTSLTDTTRSIISSYNISEQVAAELHLCSEPNDETTICFPVFMYDHLCDVRAYNHNKPVKCYSRKGAPSGLIIPFDLWINTPKSRWTWICAGEKDMAVARSHGLNAITLTGGEGASPIPLNYFKNRKVAIIYDNDAAGINGAKRLAETLLPICSEVRVVLDFHTICVEKGEDITDFFNKYHGTKEQLINFLKGTENYTIVEEPKEAPQLITLQKASEADYTNKIVKSNIQVVAISEEAFTCPYSLILEKVKKVSERDILNIGDRKEWKLSDDNLQDILHMIDNNFKEDTIESNIRALCGWPRNEKGICLTIKNRITVYKAVVTDMYETSDNISAQPTEFNMYTISRRLESGQKYAMTYKLSPHPYKGQMLVGIASDFETANTTVEDFKLTSEVVQNLTVIENLPGTITEKIHTMTEKVKGIIGYDGNDTLIEAIDLAFNTALKFNFGSFKDVRGYLDTFIISESRVGKSSTADALRRTYELGTITSLAGNSATIPGLVGGSNKTATGFQTRAGVIPQNHKGLIIFEEFGKSEKQISAELTDIRSSNEVRISRVSGTIQLPAMVRMITLTNPKTIDGQIRSIASYPNGFAILTDLVPTAEDIARYDMVVILADRGTKNIDPFWKPEEPFPQQIYKDRIRWIWSRTPEQIIISDEIGRYIMEKSNELNKKYNCHIKLFGTEAWKKISRLAIAIAGYTVSTDQSYENIIVTKECVDYAVNFLKELYDNPTFKLKQYVDNELKYTEIDEKGIEDLQMIYATYPSVVNQLELCSTTSKNTLSSSCGLEEDKLKAALAMLTKSSFIQFSRFEIIPTERFRKGVALINKNISMERL